MSIYLYIKTHQITGLKYFGKTTKKDPYSYKGSGKHWLNHLKKHGNHVNTEILGYFTQNEVESIALKFSHDNNIVESKEWGNLKPENGLDGGNHSKECKEKISIALKGRIPWNKNKTGLQKHSEETKMKMSAANSGENHPNYGKTPSDETKMKMSAAQSGENNPNYGKTPSDETKMKLSAALTGKPRSDETKMKISAAQKGIPKPKVPCPHCDMSIQKANLGQHIKARHRRQAAQ
jgi:hypothetical protein